MCIHLTTEFGIEPAEPDISRALNAIDGRVGAKDGTAERATKHEF